MEMTVEKRRRAGRGRGEAVSSEQGLGLRAERIFREALMITGPLWLRSHTPGKMQITVATHMLTGGC